MKLNIKSSIKYKDKKKKENSKKKVFSWSIILFLFIVSFLITYISYSPQPPVIEGTELQLGDVAEQDIVIKKSATLEDVESTNSLKEKARNSVPAIYEYYIDRGEQALTSFSDWFDLIKKTKNDKKNNFNNLLSGIKKSYFINLSENELKNHLKSNLYNKEFKGKFLKIVEEFYQDGIIRENEKSLLMEKGKVFIPSLNSYKNAKDVHSLIEVKKVLHEFLLNSEASKLDIKVINKLLETLLVENVLYSISLTEEKKEEAVSKIIPVELKYKPGRVILRKGDEIKESDLKVIRRLSLLDKKESALLSSFYINFFFIFLLLVFLRIYLVNSVKDKLNPNKSFFVTIATFLLSVVVYKIAYFIYPLIIKNLDFDFNDYTILLGVPFTLGALILSFVFNVNVAVIFTVVNSAFLIIVGNLGYEAFLFSFFPSLAAIYGIEYYQRLKRTPLIKTAIFWIVPINFIIIGLINFSINDNFFKDIFFFNIIMTLLSVLIAVIFANFIIPLWEIVFKLVTELKLIELTNLNLPIFREMLEKAPGTYHHSQMVASLAESAGVELDLQPLLLTAMSLYHDIGKIDIPQFFTENHSIYQNPHPNLSSLESVKNIISHVKFGVDRAEKLKLPQKVIDGITMHHGTKTVHYFYNQALESEAGGGADKIDIKDYKYPGPKPDTLESVIIMLADQVEAATKSLRNPTEEELKNVISKIIDSNVKENQFSESEDLTFKALNIIANSFLNKLKSIYHMRISYPGFNFKEGEEEEKKEDDRDK